MTICTPPRPAAVDAAMARLRRIPTAEQAFDDLAAPDWTAYRRHRSRALPDRPRRHTVPGGRLAPEDRHRR
jgi:hypothetical protein